ncbi:MULTISPECIES: LysR substrate-binding domain-containing protein [unclassified Caballeronia]|uniref:LysR substrate-binding domain-containing protein n=1 Tax=unclassified Caballeronia TaxID=2646786 RepID=UPI0028581939|nr:MULTISPECIES: LysR substrate-binding domain-containing protein [unclassified Caballeronia]MDR5816982.1 LysR substrate-binding domain-containing protein [Caballeronia sp. LZ033]MDR5823890.1 LysR substrate-binding domain-containing protein [Caballeronia sp. LZ043]
MDLAALTIFRAVVRENGVTRAALKLNRVQSNVTTRIRQLEETLGTELFVRDGRRLVLTPAGETLLPYAERLLALAEEARHAISENRPQGRLRLGTMESTAASRLPRVLAAYHRRWPQVTLELATGVTRALIESVRTFDVDAAVMARPIEPDALGAGQFDTVPVFREELTLVTPRGQDPTALAQEPAGLTLVAFERGCAYRSYAMRWYEQQGIRPARVLELASYHAIIACVAAGAGVAVAPRSVLELARLDDDVDVHPLGELGQVDTLLVWRKGHYSAALDALRDLLLDGA